MRWWRGLRGKQHFEEEMAEEMRHHVALLTEQNLAAGMDPGAARRAALLKFGPAAAIQEVAREQRPGAALETLVQDLRQGARMLRRTPGFAAVVVLTVALGLAGSTAMFSVVDGVLLRPLPTRNRTAWCGSWNGRLTAQHGGLSQLPRLAGPAGGVRGDGRVAPGEPEPDRRRRTGAAPGDAGVGGRARGAGRAADAGPDLLCRRRPAGRRAGGGAERHLTAR